MKRKILCSAVVLLLLCVVLSFWIVNASNKKLSFTRISQEEVKEMMEKDDGHIILDVRTGQLIRAVANTLKHRRLWFWRIPVPNLKRTILLSGCTQAWIPGTSLGTFLPN